MTPIEVLVWTFVIVFVATSIITLFGIIDNFKIIQVKEGYLKGLYTALLIEVAVAGVAVASGKLDPLIKDPQIKFDCPEQVDISKIPTEKGIEAVGAMITACVKDKPAMLVVLHSENGKTVFSPPAGKIKTEDNDIFETAIRETKEETGYTIKSNIDLGNSPKGNTNFKMVLGTVVKEIQPDPFFNETIGLIWINPKEIPLYSWRFPEQREWIIDLYEEIAPLRCN